MKENIYERLWKVSDLNMVVQSFKIERCEWKKAFGAKEHEWKKRLVRRNTQMQRVNDEKGAWTSYLPMKIFCAGELT